MCRLLGPGASCPRAEAELFTRPRSRLAGTLSPSEPVVSSSPTVTCGEGPRAWGWQGLCCPHPEASHLGAHPLGPPCLLSTQNGYSLAFRLTAKAVAVLLPLLGTSWGFGVLAVNSQAVVFQYVFAILNSSQVRA